MVNINTCAEKIPYFVNCFVLHTYGIVYVPTYGTAYTLVKLAM